MIGFTITGDGLSVPLELKRYLLLVVPYVLSSTLAALIIWGEDIKEYLPRLLVFTLLSSATQTATYIVPNEALRFPLEVASGFLVAWPVFKGSLKWTIKIYAISYVLGAFVMGISIPLTVHFTHLAPVSEVSTSPPWLLTAFVADLLMLGLALLINKAKIPGWNLFRMVQASIPRLWPVFLALFIQLIIFESLASENLNENMGFRSNNPVLTFVFTFLLYFISITILLLFIRSNRQASERAIQEALSDNIKEMINTIRGQRHDFLNHLQVIRILHQQDKRDALAEYLDEILLDSSKYNEILKIDNPILSALINAKIAQAEQRGIDLQVDIRAGLSEFTSNTMDIARILGNLLDNALDEVENTEEPRKVRLEVDAEGPLIMTSVINPYYGSLEEVEKSIKKGLSTKGSGHSGLGLYICRRLARKIHAGFDYTLEPGRITFTLSIPR